MHGNTRKILFFLVIITVSLAGLYFLCAEDMDSQFERARLLSEKNEYEAANSLWLKYCEKYPEDGLAFYNWGVLLSIKGQEVSEESYYKQACEKFSIASKLIPDYANTYYEWGTALWDWAWLIEESNGSAKEKWSKACHILEIATELNKQDSTAYCNWGSALDNLAKYESENAKNLYSLACEKYEKAIILDPNDVITYTAWGVTLKNLGHLETAKEKLFKAEELNSGFAAYYLACVYALENNEEKCKEWLELAEMKNTLETRKDAMNENDLVIVRDKEWFQKLKWKEN